MNPASDRAEQTTKLTFSFGRNWKSFSRFVSEEILDEAKSDIIEWLGPNEVAGKTVIDIGCGSGIHSLGFYRLGVRELLSVDLDSHSVECTQRFWTKAGKPANWRIQTANILHTDSLPALGRFDVVYSWGVLHHTGQIWASVENASRLAKEHNSRLWISLYTKGPTYDYHLMVKRRFNNWPWPTKQAYVWRWLYRRWKHERSQGRKIREWFWHGRGMNAYHDAVDWFGGLPYEVASVDEVTQFLGQRGWRPVRIKEAGEGGCSIYLFER